MRQARGAFRGERPDSCSSMMMMARLTGLEREIRIGREHRKSIFNKDLLEQVGTALVQSNASPYASGAEPTTTSAMDTGEGPAVPSCSGNRNSTSHKSPSP